MNALLRGLRLWGPKKDRFGAEDMDAVEEALLGADVGLPTTLWLLKELEGALKQKPLSAAEAHALLRARIETLAHHTQKPLLGLEQRTDKPIPYVILLVGVNGAGKTTTAAKIAHRYLSGGKRVLLAAADTFRAAAIEQLQEWGQRLKVPVVARKRGADAAAVVYEAAHTALQTQTDLLIIDTAGRLHTQHDLMRALTKMERILNQKIPNAPHETLWVLDATHGQNGLKQAEIFTRTLNVSSVVLTKWDGQAKGGLLLPIMREMKLPIRYVGTGERIQDLQPFQITDYLNEWLGDSPP